MGLVDTDGNTIDYNHIVLMPRKCLKTLHQMNLTKTTNGGFVGSNFAKKIIWKYGNAFNDVLNDHIVRYNSWLSSSGSSYDYNSTSKIMIPTEEQMIGTSSLSYNAKDSVAFRKHFEICRQDKSFILGGERYWLSNIANSEEFGLIARVGFATSYPANNETVAIRPFMCMK